jgi:phosphatidylserine/phosphatidylglycerophosphate/cardiolipin synthase-like enzyme
MKELIEKIDATLEDNILDEDEKKDLRSELHERHLSKTARIQLINHATKIAMAKAGSDNFREVMQWLRKITILLGNTDAEEFYNNAFFGPHDNLRNITIRELSQCERSMKICMFTISDNPISNAILEAQKRGVKVSIITDDGKVFDKGSDIKMLNKKGIEVRIDSYKSLMHHKFCIIDNCKVITGSYNWTRTAAEMNNENIIITDDVKIVKSFIAEFDKLSNEMELLGKW